MATEVHFDYIIVGGGTAGCVLASRLIERESSLSILLIEAGADVTTNPHVSKPLDAAHLHFSDIDFKYFTVPQQYLDNKPRYVCGVKALSGATAINSGGWIRGDRQDYEDWAREAGDDRWSYDGQLPYFQRSEHHFDPHADPEQHGFEGPMHTSSVKTSGRKYPLRDTILHAWKSLGLKEIEDANNGFPQGIAELVENRRDGLRQLASQVYPLRSIHTLTNTMVRRVILSDGQGGGKLATGVELTDGRQFYVKSGGEVLLCAGSYRSPQVLMLSGIGSKDELAKHNIPQQVDCPWVGKNFHDHQMIFRYWKLRYPEKGLAMGSPALTDPVFQRGNPADWLATMTVPAAGMQAAVAKDQETSKIDDEHIPVESARSHLESNVLYAAFGAEQIGLQIPVDGTAIMSYYMACLPSSRGSITLASADPSAHPVIDPNYCGTEADRFVMREGWRMLSQLMLETPEGKELVADEIRPEGHACLPSNASDEAIDQRIKMGGQSCSHPAASCSMGRVVDAECRVKGVHGLRVVDASVIPVPLAAHYQAPVFALAEQAVDIILASRKK
ncbi:MAG: hypothetical protein Q9191_004104 [Dirinaria sp. TL-2023a]